MNTNDAADAIRQYAKQYKAMHDIADTLQRVSSLEQAVAECEKQVTIARARRDADLADIDAEINTARQAIAAAEGQADQIRTKALTNADEIMQAARNSAKKLNDKAAEDAIAIRESAEARLQTAKDVEDEAVRKLVDLNQAGLEAGRLLAELTAETERMEARLTKAREGIANLLGA